MIRPPRSEWLERAGVFVLLLAALVMRARRTAASFDGEFDGFQGALAAIAAVNYERLGVTRFRGHPAWIVDLPAGAEAEEIGPADALVYTNHPPLVPLLGWCSLRALGPSGWERAWREGRAPEGIELALRAPFLLLHLLGLWCFHRLVRAGAGSTTAMLSLAILAMLPVTIRYGALVNYENPALPCVFAALAAYVSSLRRPSAGSLAVLGAALLLGTAITWAPAFFLPPLVLHALFVRRFALAARVAAVGSVAIAIPAAAHAMLVGGGATILQRARELLAPLSSGERPLGDWLAAQWTGLVDATGLAVVLVAATGLAIELARALVPRARAGLERLEVGPRSERIDVGKLLLLGAFGYLFAFYRHTLDAQRPFELFAAPAVAVLAANALAHLGRPLLALRAGVAPLVLVLASLLLPGLARETAFERGLRDALVPRALAEEIGQLVPRGTLAFVPTALGTNPALAFYAWRNVLPSADPSGALPPPYSSSRFLAAAPRVFLLPNDPPAAARAEVEVLRGVLEATAVEKFADARWTRYALR